MGDTETTLGSTLDGSKVALVLGPEGDGMRHNVMEHCDVPAKLPISPRMESLNISNAAAIALYAVATASNCSSPPRRRGPLAMLLQADCGPRLRGGDVYQSSAVNGRAHV